ncbi:MAG: hypothetical protein IPM29_31175 [Planctomycetes bacterium]|nr:hypothetical protein [Planctomycetota bacterium]
MNHQGHGLALNHPIFRTPNAVSFPTHTAPRRRNHEGYTSPLYPHGMGETYELVDFEVSPPASPNPTLVSHEGFFTDVPGFESLAEGESAKMLGSLALARQGRYFYWGYPIDPERLTEPAKDTLANVVHYMAPRRGEETTPFVCKTRRTLWVYLALNRETGYLRGIEEHFIGSVEAGSRADYVATPAGLERWLDDNLAYVFSGKDASHRGERYTTIFEVDDDAKRLGTPNAERASLEQWLALAAGDDREADAELREVARRLLARYVHPDIAPPDWDAPAAWYARWQDRIVFVESAGFWWLEDPRLAHSGRR